MYPQYLVIVRLGKGKKFPELRQYVAWNGLEIQILCNVWLTM